MDVHDAGQIISALTRAFPNFPMPDDAAKFYIEAIASVADPAVGYSVVTEWVSTRVLFPTIAELLEGCRAEDAKREQRARAIRAGQRSQQPGMVSCTACDDTGMEYHEDESADGRSYEFALPCRVCDPIRHQDWAEGHIRLDHDIDGCEWSLCKQRAKSKSRGRHRTRTTVSPDRGRVDTGPGF